MINATPQYIAVDLDLAALVDLVADLTAEVGESLPDNPGSDPAKHRAVLCIAARADDPAATRLGACRLGESVDPVTLTDGRMGFGPLFFVQGLHDLWDTADPRLSSVERLTEAEYSALTTP